MENLHEVNVIDAEPFFRKMRVESGYLYNFYDEDNDEYYKDWVFVPDATVEHKSNSIG